MVTGRESNVTAGSTFGQRSKRKRRPKSSSLNESSGAFRKRSHRRATLPHKKCAVPSPKQGLTSVFGMGTGVAPALWTVGKTVLLISIALVHGRFEVSARDGAQETRSSSLISEYLSELERLASIQSGCRPRIGVATRANPIRFGQASRAISIGQLHTLLRFHVRPIELLVLECSSGDRSPREISS